jgi:hypothetical protein
MNEPHDPLDPTGRTERGPAGPADAESPWMAPPTLKERTGVQRAVARLLDELAPDRAVTRAPAIPVPIERHRTPRGCILQAAAAAVSVSWFPDANSDAEFGGLQVIVWRGIVSRPGSAQRGPGGATIVRELMLRPVDDKPAGGAAGAAAEWAWRTDDGTIYDTDALVAFCLSLLEQQVTGSTSG